MPVPLVSLVIPVYNQLAYTRQCLDSITRCTNQPYELIIVDNGSTDGTPKFLREVKGTVITNLHNLGCAKAWNQGVRASRADVIGILNNDIVVTNSWLENLLKFMKNSGHGIVSPSAREGFLTYDLDTYAIEFAQSCGTATRAEVYGACLLIDRKVFDCVGLFDEEFAYGGCEDIDFFWRAQRAQFSIGMTGSALIHHFSMVTQDAIKRSETKIYSAANHAYFTRKWNRTVRGNWATRRWTTLRDKWILRYERLRYGHTLIEKCYR